MKFLANENFPKASIDFLRNNECDIIAVGVEFSGISDKEVIEFANVEDRTISTFDSDYGELIFKYDLRPKAGVIYLRIQEFSPEEPGLIILNLISAPEFNPIKKLTVYSSEGIRQRTY